MNLHQPKTQVKREEVRAYGLHARLLNPCMRGPHKTMRESFIGTLTQAKRAAQCLLLKHGPGWKVVVEADGQTAYCTYEEPR